MRLPDYDYTQSGGNFVTFYTQGWVHLLGQIDSGEMLINDLGRIVQQTWLGLPYHYAGIELGEYIVMPNHFHGIVFINGVIRTRTRTKTSVLVGAGLKPVSTNEFNIQELSETNYSSHSLSEVIRA